ncbi:MAG: XTP/dITP diphosphatase [Candidatus Eisenbacteria bacterium]|nr:XTP/dITP diphosphatase [Candidatus Eisenbacteria bacterium]
MRIVLATANRDKVRELRHALEGLAVEILTRDDFPGVPDVTEDGRTLEENALKKARALCAATGLVAVGDDTGLEVAALGGAPGVYSSRFAGAGATYAENVQKLLREMDGVPMERRGARFRCVIALIEPSGAEILVDGTCDGTILTGPRGDGGFGYDPIFSVPPEGRTFAEMTMEEKDRISHRGRAMASMRRLLAERFLLG